MIASCAFGLKVNSLQDRDNEFFTIGRDSFKFNNFRTAGRILLIRLMPKLTSAIKFEFFPTKVREFFQSMVLDTMAEREKKQIFRPDMIHILMQIRSGNLKRQPDSEDVGMNNEDAGFATVQESTNHKGNVKTSWTDDELVAQCFIFFLAGFDTSSTLASFCAYELAINQDIQQKAYEEIRTVNAGLNGGQLTYESLSKLKYLDQVVSETLRVFPPFIFLNRRCTKDYEFDIDGQKILMERGKGLWIPTYSVRLLNKYSLNLKA